MSSLVAPKTFNQLRFFTALFVGSVGFYQGSSQRSKNQAAWDTYYAKKFKANAEKHEAQHAAHHHGAPSDISPEIPEELHDLVRALTK